MPIVKEKDMTESMFKTARFFEKASAVLNRELGKTNNFALLIPGIVNSAFSLEVYFKCLYKLESGADYPKKEHNLLNLYNALDPETKKRIKVRYGELSEKNPIAQAAKSKHKGLNTELEYVLAQAGNAFVEWRYNYENEPHNFYGVDDTIRAVRQRILESKPEWKSL